MSYIQYFFDVNHLFNLRPQAMSVRAIIILLTIIIGMGAVSVTSKFFSLKEKDSLKRKTFRKVYQFLLTMSLLGLGYLFFAWQGITLLSARFWILIWLLVIIIWSAFILKYFFVDVPLMRKKLDDKKAFNKYLP